ncbi:MAG: GNAT family N-acetyltransferase [Anderseniella sp.]
MDDLEIREFKANDVGETAQIFFNAVRLGTTEYYDDRQRRAWAAKVPDNGEWRERLQSQHSFVAQLNTKPVGFMTLDGNGHIDLAFVAPDLIGKGVARALYERVEAEALRLGIRRLDTYASYLARRFFRRQGWSVVRQRSVSIGDVSMTNFAMEKRLNTMAPRCDLERS